MKKATLAAAFAAFGVIGFSAPANAGPYADDLSKCLVGSTSEADKAMLVRWIFSAVSRHKEIAPFVEISDKQREEINKATAGLFSRLLTETCRTQTRDALRYEGAEGFGAAFQTLGEVAGMQMFSDPAVNAETAKLTGYLDEKSLKAILEGTGNDK
ncbi:MAG TPA: hypothetical protein VEY50_06990 [Lysobacter sp.]|nr:hypothetical protein [Lysobacter sp.]